VWLEAFTEAMKREDLSPVTVRGYVSDLEMFFAWLKQSRGVKLGLDQISTIDLINYRQHLTAVSLKPATAQCYRKNSKAGR
jgi:site-specific recombinase XerD